jgi:hypothetical protein
MQEIWPWIVFAILLVAFIAVSAAIEQGCFDAREQDQ